MRPFGRYDVLAHIGSGGMGSVFLARISGVPGFEKVFALKVIHEGLAKDRAFVEMLMEEARIASQLLHHNIVQVHELGKEDGVDFIAMEHLKGQSLSAILNRVASGEGPMEPRLAIHVAREAAAGLHYAHEQRGFDGEPLGLVHRDVSPPNIFVTYEGAVKLVDFGIARAARRGSAAPALRAGKIPYMAPEQLDESHLDARTDIFSLGVCLWESLTGRRLFKGKDDAASAVLLATAEIPKVSSLVDGLPEELDEILGKALARDQNARHGTAGELEGDLGRCLDRLGGSVLPLDVSGYLDELFPVEKARAEQMVWATMKMEAPAIMPRAMPGHEGLEDATPSHSGVRVSPAAVSSGAAEGGGALLESAGRRSAAAHAAPSGRGVPSWWLVGAVAAVLAVVAALVTSWLVLGR